MKRILTITLFTAFCCVGMAQDLIVRQAPVDRRIKDVNNVKITKTVANTPAPANLNNPAGEFYADWDNANLWSVSGYVPTNTKIDLRGFAMPTPSRMITSKFGARWGRQHAGLDIKVYIGDTIRAAFDGKVRVVKYDARGYGNYVVIRHPNGLETLYGHMSKQLVKENSIVRAGQPIGLGGNTGRSTGSHLHFETRLAGTAVNPALMFDFEHQDVTGDFFTTRQAYGRSNSALATNMQRVQNEPAQQERTLQTASVQTEPVQATPTQQPTKSAPQGNVSNSQQTKQDTFYVVRDGDTLYSIATRNGLTVEKLCRRNRISETAPIHKGQRLYL